MIVRVGLGRTLGSNMDALSKHAAEHADELDASEAPRLGVTKIVGPSSICGSGLRTSRSFKWTRSLTEVQVVLSPAAHALMFIRCASCRHSVTRHLGGCDAYRRC